MDSKNQAPSSSSNFPPHTSRDLSELLLDPQDIEVLLGLAKNDTHREDIKTLNSRWEWFMKFSEELKLSKLEKKMPQDSGKSELMNNNQELLAKIAKLEAEKAYYMEALARERELTLAAKNDLIEVQLENAIAKERSTKEILKIMLEYNEKLEHAEEEKALNRASYNEAIKQVAFLRGRVDQLSEDRSRLFSKVLDLQATFEMRSELESKEKLIIELKTRLAEADEKIVEGEELGKKLIIELKTLLDEKIAEGEELDKKLIIESKTLLAEADEKIVEGGLQKQD